MPLYHLHLHIMVLLPVPELPIRKVLIRPSSQESGLEGSDALDRFAIDPEFLHQQKLHEGEDKACTDHTCLRMARIIQEVWMTRVIQGGRV